MEKEEAFQIIDQALNVANAKGAFKLQESATVFTALTIIKNVFENLKSQEVVVKVPKEK